MKLDRELQLVLLTDLAEHYPKMTSVQRWAAENPLVTPNMHYLFEHGLIDGSASQEMGGSKTFILAKITAAGMDFLADDGGLSAILGVVTIKLHDDTIRHLIERKILESNLPAADKTGWIDQLRGLRGESIKHLTMKLLDAGVESLPAILRAIQTSQ